MAYLLILCFILLPIIHWHNNLDTSVQGDWMLDPNKHDENPQDYQNTRDMYQRDNPNTGTMEQLERTVPASCVNCDGQALMQECSSKIARTIPRKLHWATGVWKILQLSGREWTGKLLHNFNFKPVYTMHIWTGTNSHKLFSCVEGTAGIMALAIFGPGFKSSTTALFVSINGMLLSSMVHGNLIGESLDIPVDSDDHYHAANFDQATAGSFIYRETRGEIGIYDIVPRGIELSGIIEDIEKQNKTSPEEHELFNFIMTIPMHTDPDMDGQIGDLLIKGNLSGMTLLEKKSGSIELPYSINPELFPNGKNQRATLRKMIKKMTSKQVSTLIKFAGLQEKLGYFIRSEVIIKFMHLYIGHSKEIGENEGITNRNAVTVIYHGRQTDYICVSCVYTLYGKREGSQDKPSWHDPAGVNWMSNSLGGTLSPTAVVQIKEFEERNLKVKGSIEIKKSSSSAKVSILGMEYFIKKKFRFSATSCKYRWEMCEVEFPLKDIKGPASIGAVFKISPWNGFFWVKSNELIGHKQKEDEEVGVLTYRCDRISKLWDVHSTGEADYFMMSFDSAPTDECGCSYTELCYKEGKDVIRLEVGQLDPSWRDIGTREVNVMHRDSGYSISDSESYIFTSIPVLTEYGYYYMTAIAGINNNYGRPLHLRQFIMMDRITTTKKDSDLTLKRSDLSRGDEYFRRGVYTKTVLSNKFKAGSIEIASIESGRMRMLTKAGTYTIDVCATKHDGPKKEDWMDRERCQKKYSVESYATIIMAGSVTLIIFIGSCIHFFFARRALRSTNKSTYGFKSRFMLYSSVVNVASDNYAQHRAIFNEEVDDIVNHDKTHLIKTLSVFEADMCCCSILIKWSVVCMFFLPITLYISLPISIVIGVLAWVLTPITSAIYWWTGKHNCMLSSLSVSDFLSKPFVLFHAHCTSLGKTSSQWYAVKDVLFNKLSILLLLVCLLIVTGVFSVVSFASASTLSGGQQTSQSHNFVSSCKEGICKANLEITSEILFGRNNKLTFTLTDDKGKTVGDITVSTKNLTLTHEALYRFSSPKTSARTLQASCKSQSGKGSGTCYGWRNAGPLERGSICSGQCVSGNLPLFGDDDVDYVRYPCFCTMFSPKDFSWGISPPFSGLEFIGQGYIQDPKSWTYRSFALGPSVIMGDVEITAIVDNTEKLNVKVPVDRILNTLTFDSLKGSVMFTERTVHGSSLDGEHITCKFESAINSTAPTCVVGSRDFEDKQYLHVDGEALGEKEGHRTYNLFNIERHSLGTTFCGSKFRGMPKEADDVSYTQGMAPSRVKSSCSSSFMTSNPGHKVEAGACSHRSYEDEKACIKAGEKWALITSTRPSGHYILYDCDGMRLDMNLILEIAYSSDGGVIETVPLKSLELHATGCYAGVDQLQIELRSPGHESGVIVIKSGMDGLTCPGWINIDSGSAIFNCTTEYGTDLELTAVNPTKQTDTKTFKFSLNTICDTFHYDGDCDDCGDDLIQAGPRLKWWEIAIIIFGSVLALCLFIGSMICIAPLALAGSNPETVMLLPKNTPAMSLATQYNSNLRQIRNRQKTGIPAKRDEVAVKISDKTE